MPPEIRIASPCTADWERMAGDDRVRHCAECDRKVYNLSQMTSREIERLIAASNGQRLCGRLYRRADGTMLTRDCPVGFRAVVRRVSRFAGAALSAALSVSSVAAQAQQTGSSLTQIAPAVRGINLGSYFQNLRILGQVLTVSQNNAIFGAKPANDGSYFNVVMDASGAVIPNAQVSIRSKVAEVADGITDERGSFSTPDLPTGPYDVTVQARGFKTKVQSVIAGAALVTLDMTVDLAVMGGMVVLELPPTGPTAPDLGLLPEPAPPSQDSRTLTNSPSSQPARSHGLRNFFHRLGF